MAEASYRVKIAVKDPEAEKRLRCVLNEDNTLQMMDPAAHGPADLMILELDNNDPQMAEKVDLLLMSQKTAALFVLAKDPATDLLMHLMRAGVKEVFPLPLNTGELEQAIERLKQRSKPNEKGSSPKKGRIISVVGSKGGVGTTTVAVNLAVSLANHRKGTLVALFDMNTLFGEIPLFLDLTPKFHWGEITKNIERLDQMFLMNVLCHHHSGVHLLPSPAHLNGNNAPSPEVIDRLAALMRTMFDYVIVDAGQSMVDSNLRAIQHSDEVFLISLLNMPCLSNTNRLKKSLTELGYVSENRLKVIINRHLMKSEITIKDAQKSIGSDIFGVIPNDYRTTMAAINQGRPLPEVASKSPIARTFQEMTVKLAPESEKKKSRRWRWFGS
jgi:pilus assembly protein CpaE